MINCIINGKKRSIDIGPCARLRELLLKNGNFAVRDSDDAEGFCGSDTVLLDGIPVFSNLVLAGEAEGCEIRTPDSLGNSMNLTVVQQALIDAGVVQSAYNAPAAALLMTWLFETNPDPSREDVKDVLSGIFIRDAGYEQYYLAAELIKEKLKYGEYKTKIAPEFRPHLKSVGKNKPKIDAPQLVSGERAFVEDYVDSDTCYMVVLRSPYAHAYVNKIDTSKAEALPGVIKVITAYNCPDVTYMSAGQGNPEPSPHDRKLLNKKVRHVGDRPWQKAHLWSITAMCNTTRALPQIWTNTMQSSRVMKGKGMCSISSRFTETYSTMWRLPIMAA